MFSKSIALPIARSGSAGFRRIGNPLDALNSERRELRIASKRRPQRLLETLAIPQETRAPAAARFRGVFRRESDR